MTTPNVASCSRSSTEQTSERSSNSSNEMASVSVLDLPWRVVRQLRPTANRHIFRPHAVHWVSRKDAFTTQTFVWKWSPDGRFGVDASGGRHNVHTSQDRVLAFFDLYDMTWRHYETSGLRFHVPRFAFIYWLSEDKLAIVSLVYRDHGDDLQQIPLIFEQIVLHVDHRNTSVSVVKSKIYETTESIDYNVWFHVFNDRYGEPFLANNNDKYLVFSNTKDCLVLIPYLPNDDLDVKYVKVNMNSYLRRHFNFMFNESMIVYDDLYLVPFVYREEVHLLVHTTCEKCSTVKVSIRLADFLEQQNLKNPDTNHFELLYGAFITLSVVDKPCYRLGLSVASQDGRLVVLTDGAMDKCDLPESNRLQMLVSTWRDRCKNCKKLVVVLDLETGSVKRMLLNLLPTDVLTPHPSGSILMFRYKEMYGMQMSALSLFPPLSLLVRAQQAIFTSLTSTRRRAWHLPEIQSRYGDPNVFKTEARARGEMPRTLSNHRSRTEIRSSRLPVCQGTCRRGRRVERRKSC
ncbi:unnamed protein product [Caenorhabditis auriculariae]|uniref:Uncharacterized protein n=1 Tax=Caenorhabditis auriculariae TaxID=2777116 RepID=A0A8S1HRV0_9PELO|nr:unnamed protein product [Caenorhabditis auriculariae]